MDLKNLSDAELVKLRDDLQDLHTGIIDKDIFIGSEMKAGEYTNTPASLKVNDKRLQDLIFSLYAEAYNELVERFSHKPINTEQLEPLPDYYASSYSRT